MLSQSASPSFQPFDEVSEQFSQCPSGAHLSLCNVRKQDDAPSEHLVRKDPTLHSKVQGTRGQVPKSGSMGV
jgi:hypothetical protein